MERVASETVMEMERQFGETLEIRPFFEGVSDLSYCGFQGDKSEMDIFAENMPGWGLPYKLPTEALAVLDIPVLNLGALGKDAHKNTERINLPYMMNVFPGILRFLVKRIIEVYRSLSSLAIEPPATTSGGPLQGAPFLCYNACSNREEREEGNG
jgi:arginine utilization protein RocB